MACSLVDSTISKNTSYFRVAWIHRQQGLSEMSVPPYPTTWFHMPEVYSLNICCYEKCVPLLFVWLELPAVVKLCIINNTAVSSICYTSTQTMASAIARHHPHRTHDLRSGSQDHHPSKNSVQKTICCNSTSNAPDDWRMYPKHVKLRIHQ